jgi:hypothetical protein
MRGPLHEVERRTYSSTRGGRPPFPAETTRDMMRHTELALPRLLRSTLVPLLAAVAVLGFAAVPQSAAPPDGPFDRWFTGRTMRVDYFHTSRGDTRVLVLDRVVDDGDWAGSRTRLLDDTNLGPYRVEMIDPTTQSVLYSRGFASIYGEWETVPASKTEWRTFHDSVRMPWPRQPAQIVIKRRQPDQSFRELWTTTIDPGSRFVNRAAPVAAGNVTTIQDSGPAANHVDLLLVGEGYTAAEADGLVADARRATTALFAHEPYKSRRSSFNVRVLHVPAQHSGVHRPQADSPRRTPLSLEYNVFDLERYMLTLDNRSLRDTAAGVPFDALVLLANERHYGGGGVFNAHAAVAAKNDFADYLFVHEFSHHFAALADEYYTSDVAYEIGLTDRPEPWEPNITALKSPGGLKWRDLVLPDTPVPTPWQKDAFDAHSLEYQKHRREARARKAPESELDDLARKNIEWETRFMAALPHAGRVGAFEGAGYESRGLYRSEADCIMFSRNQVGFCRVCRRAIERVIDLVAAP